MTYRRWTISSFCVFFAVFGVLLFAMCRRGWFAWCLLVCHYCLSKSTTLLWTHWKTRHKLLYVIFVQMVQQWNWEDQSRLSKPAVYSGTASFICQVCHVLCTVTKQSIQLNECASRVRLVLGLRVSNEWVQWAAVQYSSVNYAHCSHIRVNCR